MTAVSTPARPKSLDPSFNPDPEARLRALRTNIGAQHAVRSRFGQGDDDEAMQRLAAFFQAPEWATGTIGMIDALFLYEMIRCVRPQRVIEIGTGSGCSTAVALFAMAEIGAPPVDATGVETVHGFDVMRHCYFDSSKPIGDAAREIAPRLVGGLRVHTAMGAAEAAELFAPDPVSFAFIDADHRHPCPTADLLELMPALRPGAWIALHDVDLAAVAQEYTKRTGEQVDWAHHGGQWLFERWPFEKIAGVGGARNIGAIRLPEKGRVSASDLKELIDLPWECKVSDRVQEALGRK